MTVDTKEYSYNPYLLWPFAVVVGTCFILMLAFMVSGAIVPSSGCRECDLLYATILLSFQIRLQLLNLKIVNFDKIIFFFSCKERLGPCSCLFVTV